MGAKINLFVDDNTGFYCVAPEHYDRMVALLRRLEYACYHDGKEPVCPSCGVTQHLGETDMCELNQLLTEVGRE